MSKKKAYVVGTNVSSSLSPTIFKYWFKKYNIDGEYGFIELKESSFNKKIMPILNDRDLVGLNITMPFKEKIIAYLPEHLLDPASREIGAVNWIYKTPEGEWCGSNSDFKGFQRSAESYFIKKNTAIVVGYGGVAKAIIYTLINELKYSKIKIFNRSYEKIKSLPKIKLSVDHENPHHNGKQNLSNKHIIEAHKLEKLEQHTEGADLIINTTPINILGHSKKWNISQDTVGFDVVYKPVGGTGFLNHFVPPKRIEGINMLVHQAAPCFGKWFEKGGFEPKFDDSLLKALNKKMEEK